MVHTPDDPTKAQVWITKGLDDLDFEFYFPQGPKGDPGPFTNTPVLSGTNLNDLVSPGIYSVGSGSDAAASAIRNLPFHESGSLVVTLSQENASIQIQTFTTNTKSIYVRRRFNGTWGSWRHFGTSRVDQTAGRVMYHWDEFNQREQLIYGDTGRRNISSSITTAVSGQVLLARQNNTVMLILADFLDSSPNTNVNWNGIIPVGFRPQNWIYMPIPSNRTMTIQNGGNVTCVSGGLTPNTTVYQGCLTWRTEEAWPTTLPGVAVGSLPFN